MILNLRLRRGSQFLSQWNAGFGADSDLPLMAHCRSGVRPFETFRRSAMTAFDPKQRLERYETQEFRMPDSVRALYCATA